MRGIKKFLRRQFLGAPLGFLLVWATSHTFRVIFTLGTCATVMTAGALFVWLSKFEIFRFVVVGGAATVIHYVLFLYLTERRKIWYQLSGAMALVSAFSFSFSMYKLWVFASVAAGELQFAAFVTKKTVFFVGNSALLHILVEHVHLRPRWAQLIAFVVLGVLSFFVTRWIFTNEISALIPF